MKSLLCLMVALVLLGAAGPAQAQLPRTPDSLAALLRQPGLPDTTRVIALAKLGSSYRQTDLRKGRGLSEQALALARRIHYRAGEVKSLLSLYSLTASAREYVQAERLAQQALKLTENAPPQLLPSRVKALEAMANVSNSTNNDFKRATQYYRQAMAVARQIRPANPVVLNGVIMSLASCYVNRFQSGEMTDSVRRQALYYARLGQRNAEAQHDDEYVGEALVSQAIIARSTGQLDSGAYFLQRALPVFERSNNLNSAAFAWLDLAFIRNGQDRFADAVPAARQALRLATQVQDTRTQYGAYKELSKAYAGQGNYRQAYDASRHELLLTDSLYSMMNVQSLNDLEVRFDTKRKESDIRALNQQQRQQRQLLWSLAAGLLAVLAGAGVAVVLALRLRRSRALLAAQHTELVQTRAAQDRLYALVAHDLRSPVVAFTGLADLLNRYVQRQDTARLAGLGGRIRQAAQNLSELLDNLLNWAVSQRGELVPAPRPLRATELLAEIADLYQNAAEAADVTLTVEAPPDLLVQADPNMTRTILRNLAGNALKATPAGGHVRLRAEQQPNGIRLQITDTGQGLDAQTLAQLAAGPRLHVAEKGRGAGLGLLLSRNFAEAQGGELVLANLPDGSGTVATLTLPLAA